jgi:pectinesterase
VSLRFCFGPFPYSNAWLADSSGVLRLGLGSTPVDQDTVEMICEKVSQEEVVESEGDSLEGSAEDSSEEDSSEGDSSEDSSEEDSSSSDSSEEDSSEEEHGQGMFYLYRTGPKPYFILRIRETSFQKSTTCVIALPCSMSHVLTFSNLSAPAPNLLQPHFDIFILALHTHTLSDYFPTTLVVGSIPCNSPCDPPNLTFISHCWSPGKPNILESVHRQMCLTSGHIAWAVKPDTLCRQTAAKTRLRKKMATE